MDRRRRLKILGLVLLGLGVVFAAPGFYAYNYVNHDPQFCLSCHLMEDAYGRWQTSEHSKVNCHDCHTSDTIGDLKRLYFSVLEPKAQVENHAWVDNSFCLRCHEAGGERFERVLTTAGHSVHVVKNAMQCMDCHSQSVHRFTPEAQVCVKCHDKLELHERKMDQLECLDCHNYLAQDPAATLMPRGEDCHRCHGEERRLDKAESPNLRERIAALASPVPMKSVHGNQECGQCHNPHKSKLEEKRAGVVCVTCHEKENEIITARTAELTAKGLERHECKSCHAPHEMPGASRDTCVTCHEPYGSELTVQHEDKCDTCHQPHELQANAKDCASCHETQEITLAAMAPPEHGTCDGCHEPHPSPAMETGCAACHGDKEVASRRARVEEHQACESCHDPHGGRPAPNAECMSCHDDQARSLASATAREHATCRSCHMTSHGQPETGSGTCKSCHEKEAALSKWKGGPQEHQACESCHAPHDPGARVDTARCTSCHEKEATLASDDKHENKCGSCHAPHGPSKQPANATCISCHEKVELHTNKGGKDHEACISCHTPHRTAAQTVENRCNKCHEQKVDGLGVWAAVADHQRCASCHVGHDAGKAVDCASCHEKEAKSASHTKHGECSSCHRPHDTKALGATAWWDDCARCHINQAAAVKTRTGPKHSDCASCHPSHDFPEPTCLSCHESITKQLMHQVSDHRDCRSCHDTHGRDPPMRATCLSCHQEQKKDHFPEAQRCDACHPFAEGVQAAVSSTRF